MNKYKDLFLQQSYNDSTAHYAEIIARAVLRAPDIIKTSNKFVQSPVAHVEKAEDGVAKPSDRELKAYLAK